MADDKNQNAGDGGTTKKKPSMITGIIAGVLVAVVFAVGIFIGVKIFGGSSGDKNDTKKDKTEKHQDEEAEDEEETTSKVVKLVVPTKEDLIFSPRGSSTRYVVVALGFEVEDEKAKDVVEKELMIPIQSEVLKKLRSYSLDELQQQGLQDSLPLILKKEIKPFFHDIKLRNVYMSKFLIQ
ncbi:MAG: flagellar basal body-associated FliL family protein [Ignavibacteriae bacterium]|nr:flagellar basal body-associated FliL family protein [Ignavibacteriota bacterium]